MNITTAIGVFLFALSVAMGVALLFAYPTLWCVNYLFTSSTLTAVFGVPALTFWKAFWLNFLISSILKPTSSKKEK